MNSILKVCLISLPPFLKRRSHRSAESLKCGGAIGFAIACSLLLLTVGTTNAADTSIDVDRPNIVIVITDDQGYGDLSCHGNPVLETPELDRLYRDSIRLTDYHVAPTCSPTRAALQTGHWTDRTGVWHTIMGRSLLREGEVTMGRVFRDAGYATGMFGKWHLGDNHPFRPEDRGYSEVFRHGGGGVGQTPDYWNNAYFGGHYWHNGSPVPADGFCTDVFFDAAMRFIRQQKQAGTPFMAYISTNAPHGPMHSPPEFSRPYREHGVALSNFYGMIANIDHNVGKLRAFLEQEGLDENTIFLFTTDNGTAAGAKVFNADMRGAKGSEYDGGHRVPMFVRWPAGGLTGGRDVEPIAAHVDVLPTLIDLCNVPAPDGVTFDGRSIKPLLDRSADDWPDRILVTDSQRVIDPVKWRKTAVMTSRWRLVNGRELYDISADPGQQSNVAADHPEVVDRLTAFYDRWWDELKPTFAEAAHIHLGHPAENPARLTAHDWITQRLTPWNQALIRRALGGDENTGYWNVEIVEGGDYGFRLRRWPSEVDEPINAPLPPAADVPGVAAYRTTPGKSIEAATATVRIGDQSATARIEPDAKEVVFRLRLNPGRTRLNATFAAPNGTTYGAYYVYVEKK